MNPDSCHPRTLIEILQWIMGGPLIFTFLRVRFHKSLKWTGLQNLCLHPALVCWSSNKKKAWTDHPETITSIPMCWKYIRIIYFSTMLPPAPNTQKGILLTINCWEHWHRPIKALFTCDWAVYKAMRLDVMLVNDVNNLITVFLIALLLIVISLT